MGFVVNGKQINNSYSFGSVFVLNASLVVLISILLNVYYCPTLAESKQQSDKNVKKKVVIVGEMSDMFANESIRIPDSDSYDDQEFDTYEEVDPNHSRFRRFKPINPKEVRPLSNGQYKRRKKKPPGAMFVPVAAYSITKTKNKPLRTTTTNSYRKRQGGPIRRNPDFSDKHTESAVYGYMQRPEIIEFRGQYFYGPRPGEPYDGPLIPAGSSAEGVRHPYPHYGSSYGPPSYGSSSYGSSSYGPPSYGPPSYGPPPPPPSSMDSIDPHGSPSSAYGTAHYGSNRYKGGIGPGGLLLATLPLILAPMLSYLFTPMIIPITATVAAGKRRKRDALPVSSEDSLQVMISDINMNSVDQKLLNDGSFDTKTSPKSSTQTESRQHNSESDRLNDPKYKEAQVVVEYLRRVQFDERATTRAIANYLQCDGMLADEDHCIERLSCEFSDPNNSEAPELDRAVTSIILGHILANEYITDSFKIKLKLSAIYGKDNSGKCQHKYNCNKVENKTPVVDQQ